MERAKVSARFILSGSLFALCGLYISRNFQWARIASAFSSADPFLLIFGGAATLVAYWMVRTLRWMVLLRSVNIRVGFVDVYVVTAASLGLSLVTPMGAGEIAKVELLKGRKELDRLTGYGTFLLERALDLIILAVIAALCLVFRFESPISDSVLIIGVLFAVLVSVVVLVLKRVQKLRTRLGEVFRRFSIFLKGPGNLLALTALTVLAWGIVALGWFLFLRSLDLGVGYLDGVGLVSITTIVNVLSMVPGALGVAEVTITEFLVRIGQEPGAAQAGAVVLRLYGLYGLVLGLAHLVLLKRRKEDLSYLRENATE
jgi:uncharacterized protein (TIRG00374 family)